ncbi:hypothetical protein DPMN_077594 [Dreissena polymorpha]|uniref:Uncharacterized protein n=1 Tax=Dreissena polymorpha TaxID=45954 RepID=A0A9D4BGS3_DREPO|nr:hypothetical protein DPMN_077594 [Dreissena polymorpha]
MLTLVKTNGRLTAMVTRSFTTTSNYDATATSPATPAHGISYYETVQRLGRDV